MLPINIQLLAEGQDPSEQNPTIENQKQPGKVFTEDYVSALRGESAGYRTKAKSYEIALRSILGVKDGEELGDIDSRLSAYQKDQTAKETAALEAANTRLISAEIRNLEGFNIPLLERLIDRTKISVNDQGQVLGLKEAAEELSKQFPEVKKIPPRFSNGSTRLTETTDKKSQANAAIRSAFGHRKD